MMKKTRKEDLLRMQSIYNYSIIDGLLDGFKCGHCQKEATKRCSKCKQEFYCSRECQVTHWKEHKKVCKPIVQEAKIDGVNEKSSPEGEKVKENVRVPKITEVSKTDNNKLKTDKSNDAVYDELE